MDCSNGVTALVSDVDTMMQDQVALGHTSCGHGSCIGCRVLQGNCLVREVSAFLIATHLIIEKMEVVSGHGTRTNVVRKGVPRVAQQPSLARLNDPQPLLWAKLGL